MHCRRAMELLEHKKRKDEKNISSGNDRLAVT